MTSRDIDQLQRSIPRCAIGFLMAPIAFVSPAAAAGLDRAVSFVNDVVPVLTKAGCNAGVCHAKAGGGQNGFQLSLLGFEPQEDYEHLVLEGRGRRLFPAHPERSLLLMKATGQVPHGGGVRFDATSESYALLRGWILQGTPNTTAGEPELSSITVEPSRGLLTPHGTQQLKSIAHYSDGTFRDVTALALYECNDSAMAEVTSTGLVTATDIPGKVAVMLRYQGRVAVYNAAVPLGAPVETLPEARNFVDELVFANLKELGIPPSPICDDATFLRRVSVDIGGRLPTESEAREFLASTEPDKR
ncbi:MAG: DUF1549 domain-containing protein, partial [Planctomycetia bacterium]|nr:DUF1549 domain-containing protein [Planctomycetia bacterium]